MFMFSIYMVGMVSSAIPILIWSLMKYNWLKRELSNTKKMLEDAEHRVNEFERYCGDAELKLEIIRLEYEELQDKTLKNNCRPSEAEE